MPEKRLNDLTFKHIIPSGITYINMFLGIGAMFISITGGMNNFKLASILIILAGITDKLDGYVARRLNVASDFGRELDSLCDIISFGISPTILWWSMNMGRLGIDKIISSIFFISAGVYRLARFNIMKEDKYIRGLPITLAGMAMATKYILDIIFRKNYINNYIINYENSLIMILLSFMMVSNFKVKRPL